MRKGSLGLTPFVAGLMAIGVFACPPMVESGALPSGNDESAAAGTTVIQASKSQALLSDLFEQRSRDWSEMPWEGMPPAEPSLSAERVETIDCLPDSAAALIGPPLIGPFWYAVCRAEATVRQPQTTALIETLWQAAGTQLARFEDHNARVRDRLFLHAQALWLRHWRENALAGLGQPQETVNIRPVAHTVVQTDAPAEVTGGGEVIQALPVEPWDDPVAAEEPAPEWDDATAAAAATGEPSVGALAADEIERLEETGELEPWDPWDPVDEAMACEPGEPLLHQWETEPEADFEDAREDDAQPEEWSEPEPIDGPPPCDAEPDGDEYVRPWEDDPHWFENGPWAEEEPEDFQEPPSAEAEFEDQPCVDDPALDAEPYDYECEPDFQDEPEFEDAPEYGYDPQVEDDPYEPYEADAQDAPEGDPALGEDPCEDEWLPEFEDEPYPYDPEFDEDPYEYEDAPDFSDEPYPYDPALDAEPYDYESEPEFEDEPHPYDPEFDEDPYEYEGAPDFSDEPYPYDPALDAESYDYESEPEFEDEPGCEEEPDLEDEPWVADEPGCQDAPDYEGPDYFDEEEPWLDEEAQCPPEPSWDPQPEALDEDQQDGDEFEDQPEAAEDPPFDEEEYEKSYLDSRWNEPEEDPSFEPPAWWEEPDCRDEHWRPREEFEREGHDPADAGDDGRDGTDLLYAHESQPWQRPGAGEKLPTTRPAGEPRNPDQRDPEPRDAAPAIGRFRDVVPIAPPSIWRRWGEVQC